MMEPGPPPGGENLRHLRTQCIAWGESAHDASPLLQPALSPNPSWTLDVAK